MIVLQNYKQYNICKEMFLRFSAQFSKGNLYDIEFFRYHRDLMRMDPQTTHYAYQFALYSCYKNNKYDSRELEKIFEKNFKIKDVYGMNGVECDISTLNTAFIVDYIQKQTPFKNIPIVIFNAPLEYGTDNYKYVQNSLLVKSIVEKSRVQTGQSNNDLQIGDRLYDIKHTQKTSSVLNHIYPLTREEIESKGDLILNNITEMLKNTGTKYSYELYEYFNKVNNIRSLTTSKKFTILNEHLASNWLEIEKHEIKIPIIIQMTPDYFKQRMLKSYHEKLHLPANVTENEHAARRAIINSIDIRYKKNTHEIYANAKQMTNGLIDSTPMKDNTLDMLD